MEELKLTNERAKAWLESIVKSELENIQNRRAAEQDCPLSYKMGHQSGLSIGGSGWFV
ncbi:hypothetical protein [Martelella mediterranea]|nr:hypothetical protein [Martelella mediterranea]